MNKYSDSRRCPLCDSDTGYSPFIDRIYDDRFGFPEAVSIQHCLSCDLFFTWPRFAGNVSSLYEAHYQRTSLAPKTIFRDAQVEVLRSRFARWFLGLGNSGQYFAKRNCRILDIGSGSGQAVLEAKLMGLEVVGYDVDRHSSVLGSELGIHIQSGEKISTSMENLKFDWIQLNQVVEHYVDPLGSLREISDLLSPGGSVFISTPNSRSLARRCMRKRWIHWHVPYHQQHFNPKSIKWLLAELGYENIRVTYRTPSLWLIIQLRALLTRPSLGSESQIWKQQNSNLDEGDGSTNRLMLLPLIVVSVAARVLDFCRLGDCLVIIAEKNS
jgi:2-polyprenyl-3-methyl-5-hydroxy-6-metoxy-1,4-benzoquinol methylase